MKKGLMFFVAMILLVVSGPSFATEEEVKQTEEVLEIVEVEPMIDSEGIIMNSELFQTLDEKINYLITKGNELIELDEHEGAREVAEYILTKLDKDSEDAQDLLETAELVKEDILIADANAEDQEVQ